jgi:hypothetical protein
VSVLNLANEVDQALDLEGMSLLLLLYDQDCTDYFVSWWLCRVRAVHARLVGLGLGR